MGKNQIPKAETSFVLLFIVVGVGLSSYQFLINRSLWLDEASLSLNIINKDYRELLKPLDYHQVAPILFLIIEKFISTIFNNTEYGLRLFPLLCYWSSIYLIYRVTYILTNANISKAAVSIFCVLPTLIYYSSEVKQYMVDVFTLLLIYYVCIKEYKNANVKIIVLISAGCISIFISNIALIVLFSMGFYLLVDRKNFNYKFVIVISSWIAAFLLYYFNFIHQHPLTKSMVTYWKDAFLPNNPLNSGCWHFIFKSIQMVFGGLLSFQRLWPICAVLYFIVLLKIFYDKKLYIFYLMISPILIHLALSSLQLYPFAKRLILYQLPLYIIVISIGVSYLYDITKSKLNFPLILFLPAMIVLYHQYPIENEEIKETIQYLNNHIESGDKVYVYHGSKKPYNYYNQIGYVQYKNEVFYGRNPRNKKLTYEELEEDLKLLNGRVWFIFSHALKQEDYIVNYISSVSSKNEMIKRYKVKGASIYLFEIGTKLTYRKNDNRSREEISQVAGFFYFLQST